MRRPRPARRPARTTALVATLAAALAAPAVAALPARADHASGTPGTVSLMGTLQSEIGCAADWDTDCTANSLQPQDDGSWALDVSLPEGEYVFKVRLNRSWDENYGADGQANGADIPLVLEEDAQLRFSYDHASHRVAVAPAEPAEPLTEADEALAGTSLRTDLTRERFYFVMADRFANGDPGNDSGGLTGGRLETGFDPTDEGFFHGGDLQGLIDRLDYIEDLGTSAIWLTPSFKNKPVQGTPGQESAGYHGYWVTDFTQIDPHLGTNEELAELVDRAHERGIKVFFDIITNHTADVLGYEDGAYAPNGEVPYRSKADFPYRDADGTPFDDRNPPGGVFPEVDLESFPYRPTFLQPGDETAKTPDWLNDPTMYHNRGTSTFAGENSEYGDFPSGNRSALDDLWTERPEVRQGMIDIYQTWVREAGIDGFRIDTVKHVDIGFWQQFAPALEGYAASIGNDDFFMFGEVYDSNPAFVSQYTTTGRMQAAVDFGFQGSATGFAKGDATTKLRDFFASDDWYTDADSNVYSLPTFLGNHDMGRIGSFLRQNGEGWTDAELLQRDRLAHSLMYLTRGQPVVYYGDEQGFSAPPDVPGGVGDRRAREDMFASQVGLYNGYDLIGTDATTAEENYDTDHPLFRHIAELAALREQHPALADGAQVHRYASGEAGIYAFSRVGTDDEREYVVAVNNAEQARTATFDTFSSRGVFAPVWPASGDQLRSDREGRVTVTVPPLSAVVYRAAAPVKPDRAAPQPFFATPGPGGVVGGRAELGVSVPGDAFTQVTLAWRPVGAEEWQVLGTDDNAPHRVFHDVGSLDDGTLVEYRAVAQDADGDLGVAQTYAVVGEPPAPGGGSGGGGGPVTQPSAVSVPGSFNSEVGCPGDWQPDCAAVDLTLDEQDQVWKKTFTGTQAIPEGGYAYKVALEDSWDENYGAGAVRNGPDIPLDVPAGTSEVTFYYSRATNWVTNSLETPDLFVAPGSFQSELGCPGDWQPDCMRSWLQDPDGDGTWTFRSEQLPPGDYEVKVAQDLSWDTNWGQDGVPNGGNIRFSVGEREGVLMSFDEASKVLTVTTFPTTGGGAGSAPDLSVEEAHWLTRDLLAWDLPGEAESRRGWTYRLHYAADGGLGLDAEAVTGGSSLPLTEVAGGLPAELRDRYPHLAGLEALQVDRRFARSVPEILRGQVAVASYDALGRLRDAAGVQLPGVLDDLYAGAAERPLGVTWRGATPSLALWAPTAKKVDVLVYDSATSGTGQRVAMRRDADGVWTARGSRAWKGRTYLYEVTVYAPTTGRVETNLVTDPYSLGLTTNSQRSVLVDLDDPALEPAGWDRLAKPTVAQPEDQAIYELHVRDFSISDETVPAAERGTYAAFARTGSDGMQHLSRLADAGLTTVHLLPTFDIATIEERRSAQAVPDCDLEALAPDSTEQQACIEEVRARDGFNWGYDPYHYTTPEGSYATDPEGTARTREFRQMVAALNGAGLRVVQDVVYNHTAASGQAATSVLDKVVPGYYHRLNAATGEVERSTCCENTATEHRMMEKLMVDSVVTWAREYKVDGFRFDLMGHHSKANMLAVRAALDELTVEEDGVDGKAVYLYGEGWNFGEVANDARFEQATQANMAGTGIGTFTDRLRDAVRGGGPFDDTLRKQGFASGLATQPNGPEAGGGETDGTPEEQRNRLLLSQDQIKVGLAGGLKGYRFVDRTGAVVRGDEVDYNGSPTGYVDDPSETVVYVDAHDNETLFDALTAKLDEDVTPEERARMNTVALSTTALSQGVSFWHAGTDLLRSKSLDRNSYDSGDWFNEIDWSGQESTFGRGLPPAADNEAKWPEMQPLLANPELKPTAAQIQAASARAADLLRVRSETPLLTLGDAALVQERVRFPQGGPDQPLGVIAMHVDDVAGADLDPGSEGVVVVFNATPTESRTALGDLAGQGWSLHPAQAGGSDPVVQGARYESGSGAFVVPPRTTAVFVLR